MELVHRYQLCWLVDWVHCSVDTRRRHRGQSVIDQEMVKAKNKSHITLCIILQHNGHDPSIDVCFLLFLLLCWSSTLSCLHLRLLVANVVPTIVLYPQCRLLVANVVPTIVLYPQCHLQIWIYVHNVPVFLWQYCVHLGRVLVQYHCFLKKYLLDFFWFHETRRTYVQCTL